MKIRGGKKIRSKLKRKEATSHFSDFHLERKMF